MYEENLFASTFEYPNCLGTCSGHLLLIVYQLDRSTILISPTCFL